MTNVKGASGPSAVSCPSIAFCVALSGGNVVTSSNPSGGSSAWTVTRVDGTNALSAISCPSTDFCAAVDDVGNVVTSNNPRGGAAAWALTHVDGSNCTVQTSRNGPLCALLGVSCPSSGFCVASDYWGNVVVSSDPRAGASAWKLVHVSSNLLASVSCPSRDLCIAVDILGNAVISSNPSGGSSAWKVVHIDGPGCVVTETYASCFLSSVSCPATSFCVAVDEFGKVVTSINPVGGTAAWKITDLSSAGSLRGVSCPTTGQCFAIADDNEAKGVAVTSNKPTGGASAWTMKGIGGNQMNGISCPSSGLCVVVSAGGLIISSNPAVG